MSQRRFINPGEIREERELCKLRPSTVRRMKKNAVRVSRHDGRREERLATVEVGTVMLEAASQHNLLIGRMTSAHAYMIGDRHYLRIFRGGGVSEEACISGNGGEL